MCHVFKLPVPVIPKQHGNCEEATKWLIKCNLGINSNVQKVKVREDSLDSVRNPKGNMQDACETHLERHWLSQTDVNTWKSMAAS